MTRSRYVGVCLAALACGPPAGDPAGAALRPEWEPAVYAAAYAAFARGGGARGAADTVLVLAATRPWEHGGQAADARRALAGAVPGALADAYVRANAAPARLAAPPAVPGRAAALVEAYPRAGPGGAPRAAVQFSRPAFSAGGDTAVVEVTRVCGLVCGRSELLVLVRGPAGWRRGLSVRNVLF